MALDLDVILDEIDDSGSFTADAQDTVAPRIAICPSQYVLQVTQQLMGYAYRIGDNIIRVGAYPHPFLPGLRVKSVEAMPIGKRPAATWSTGGGADHYKLTVNYAIPTWNDDDEDDNDDPENDDSPEPSQLYLTQSLDYSTEILSVPTKARDYVYPGMWSEVIVKKSFRIPLVAYTATYERIPKPQWATIIALVGTVSTTKMFGAPPGTILFDGAHADRTAGRGPDFTKSSRFWKVAYKFLFHPQGWNNVLHPESLKWVPANSVDGAGNLPYETNDLKQLFTG